MANSGAFEILGDIIFFDGVAYARELPTRQANDKFRARDMLAEIDLIDEKEESAINEGANSVYDAMMKGIESLDRSRLYTKDEISAILKKAI